MISRIKLRRIVVGYCDSTIDLFPHYIDRFVLSVIVLIGLPFACDSHAELMIDSGCLIFHCQSLILAYRDTVRTHCNITGLTRKRSSVMLQSSLPQPHPCSATPGYFWSTTDDNQRVSLSGEACWSDTRKMPNNEGFLILSMGV